LTSIKALVKYSSVNLASDVIGLGQSWNPNTYEYSSFVDRAVIEPCLRFGGFQRRLFLCILAQTGYFFPE
jgi:hypothetical protein